MKYGGSVRSNRTDPPPPCLEGQPRLVQTRQTVQALSDVMLSRAEYLRRALAANAPNNRVT